MLLGKGGKSISKRDFESWRAKARELAASVARTSYDLGLYKGTPLLGSELEEVDEIAPPLFAVAPHLILLVRIEGEEKSAGNIAIATVVWPLTELTAIPLRILENGHAIRTRVGLICNTGTIGKNLLLNTIIHN
jgi:hypothetical protein